MLDFDARNLSPMLFRESEEVFDSADHLYELKFDGIRSLAYLDDGTDLVNKRGKLLNATYPELADLHSSAKEKVLLDGEILLVKDGKPDFYALQKRAMMTDPLKIKIQAEMNPVVYVAFDLLYLKDGFIIDKPLIERKKLLEQFVKESKQLAISKYIENRGKELFQAAKKMNLEGIVAKEKNSPYYPGKRSSVWLKMKVYKEEDLIILGYVPKEHTIDLVLGRYQEGKFEKAGTVVTGKFKDKIVRFSEKHPAEPHFPEPKNAIWMLPKLVGRVRYMMKTKTGGLRQPVFMGLRDDKFVDDLS